MFITTKFPREREREKIIFMTPIWFKTLYISIVLSILWDLIWWNIGTQHFFIYINTINFLAEVYIWFAGHHKYIVVISWILLTFKICSSVYLFCFELFVEETSIKIICRMELKYNYLLYMLKQCCTSIKKIDSFKSDSSVIVKMIIKW